MPQSSRRYRLQIFRAAKVSLVIAGSDGGSDHDSHMWQVTSRPTSCLSEARPQRRIRAWQRSCTVELLDTSGTFTACSGNTDQGRQLLSILFKCRLGKELLGKEPPWRSWLSDSHRSLYLGRQLCPMYQELMERDGTGNSRVSSLLVSDSWVVPVVMEVLHA